MKQIGDLLLDSLSLIAKESPRKRSHYNLHSDLNDSVQRLCIAMEPATYVRPHRHADPETWEVLIILRGSLAVNIFDEKGKVVERTVLTTGGPVTALEMPLNSWHAPASLEPGTIVFEIKQGPYKALEEKNLAPWAPPEGSSDSAMFVDWFQHARVGDLPPVYRGG